jgi:hypothetical protein
MNEDSEVKMMVRGILLKQLEFIRRDPYANAFKNDGSVFERKLKSIRSSIHFGSPINTTRLPETTRFLMLSS